MSGERLLSLAEAQERVLACVRPLGAERVSVAESAGRITAEDARAVVDLPPFPSSAMDGFAVRAEDVPGRLPVRGESAAGAPAGEALAPGTAVAISTGGVVPAGADAVIPVEYVVRHDNEILAEMPLEQGQNVRPRGGDIAAGEVVVGTGTRLAAAQIGALAASGVTHVLCARRPRVAVVATGSELVAPGDPLGPGQVYEANGVMLAAALAAAGARIEAILTVADDEHAHRAALERGLEADVLVTSGGVSVGEHDLVRRIERELGVEEVFWRVAIKPGKPVSFAIRGGTLVFGLPGNPVSALVGSELFVKPALRALQGVPEPLPRLEPGRLASALRRNDVRDELVRAQLRLDPDGPVLEPLVGQGSHMIARAAAADALVLVPRGEGELAAGERVTWLRLGTP